MPTPPDPQKGLPNTYVVQDRFNKEEITRLRLQDHLITEAMGGVLPEQPDATTFSRVLDVACGAGDWLIEAAETYPHLSRLIGIDANSKLIEYARKAAVAAGVSDRVEFHVMDALGTLDFPQGYFDLVNHRAAAGWLRTWDWPNLLHEYRRVCQPGGVIRATEAIFIKESNSPALNRLAQLVIEALYNAGHYFEPQSDGVIGHLPGLLQRSGVQNVQTRTCTPHRRAGTPEWQGFFEDFQSMFRTVLPFLHKWTRVPDNYEEIYQQMLVELQRPDFEGIVEILTVWGINTPLPANPLLDSVH